MRRLRGRAAAAGEISRSESVPCFSPDDMANTTIGSGYASPTISHGVIRHGGFFLTTATRVGGRDDIQPLSGSYFSFPTQGTCAYVGLRQPADFIIFLGAYSELP
jgi:hypothetical protein